MTVYIHIEIGRKIETVATLTAGKNAPEEEEEFQDHVLLTLREYQLAYAFARVYISARPARAGRRNR